MAKSAPKMAGGALRLRVRKSNVAQILCKAEVSSAQGETGRANGRPRAPSGRGETQLPELTLELQDSDDLGEATARATYRIWAGETCPSCHSGDG